jgi:hypothetical protein
MFTITNYAHTRWQFFLHFLKNFSTCYASKWFYGELKTFCRGLMPNICTLQRSCFINFWINELSTNVNELPPTSVNVNAWSIHFGLWSIFSFTRYIKRNVYKLSMLLMLCNKWWWWFKVMITKERQFCVLSIIDKWLPFAIRSTYLFYSY